MSDDQETQKSEDKQIQTNPVEIEATEDDGKVVESPETAEPEAEKVEEISPEEQKKIEEELKASKAKDELDGIRKEMRPGDTVKVYTKIKEGDKERIQAYQGIIISKRGSDMSQSFMVRKIAVGGVGVEKIWPVYSPSIVKIEIMQKSKSRQSKLYYLRDRIGKAAMLVKKRV